MIQKKNNDEKFSNEKALETFNRNEEKFIFN